MNYRLRYIVSYILILLVMAINAGHWLGKPNMEVVVPMMALFVLLGIGPRE